MTAPVLLLSDLHLPNTASPLREAFLRFVEGPARAASAVYILGDLFEYWIGDAEGLRDYATEARALKQLSERSVPIYFMHGNRDFLVGSSYARAGGLQLLPDPVVVDLAGTRTLLSHGDRWCIDDHAYQRWRRFSRNPVIQTLFRPLPEFLRRRIAGTARSRSDTDKRNKPESIMDVNAEAVAQAVKAAGVRRLIHGHTHRPAEHGVMLGREAIQRIVLADWREDRFEYLSVDAAGCRRLAVPALSGATS